MKTGLAPSIALDFEALDATTSRARAASFRATMASRRSVRHFSEEAVDLEAIEHCIAAAASAPSGANKQPWTFVLVTDPATKRAIREAAEEEERSFYGGRAPQAWLDDLAPLGTDAEKAFLEVAPALIVIFAQKHGSSDEAKHYYVQESVGIATGILIAALHHAGFATLTHTPSPMGFLGRILERPASERAYLLMPVGKPAPGCRVPAIERKSAADYLVRR
jgi:iodotyrosine deiodinase